MCLHLAWSWETELSRQVVHHLGWEAERDTHGRVAVAQSAEWHQPCIINAAKTHPQGIAAVLATQADLLKGYSVALGETVDRDQAKK